jgi:hypothetical protein
LTSTQLVAGLFPRATGITDPDVVSALRDRANAIEEHARYLAIEAIDRGDSWLHHFGEVPDENEHFEPWLREVVTGTTYLELWGIEDFSSASKAGVNPQQQVQHDRVLRAMEQARVLSGESDSPNVSNFGQPSVISSEPSILEFVFDR